MRCALINQQRHRLGCYHGRRVPRVETLLCVYYLEAVGLDFLQGLENVIRGLSQVVVVLMDLKESKIETTTMRVTIVVWSGDMN